jgi:hypothetical protein
MDKAKVEMIEQLPSPTDVKVFEKLFRPCQFYRRFIKDSSKITKILMRTA